MRSPAPPNPARALPAVVVLALLCLAASPALAGFGDLVKAAKNKAVQAAAPKSARAAGGGAESVEFTDEIIELTSARLDQGFAAAASITSGRPALVARRTQMESEASALQERHGKAIDAASSRHSDAEQCWDHSLDAKREARSSEMRDKMMADPAMREKMMAIGQRMSQAQAKGDAEGMRKAQNMRTRSPPCRSAARSRRFTPRRRASTRCAPVFATPTTTSARWTARRSTSRPGRAA